MASPFATDTPVSISALQLGHILVDLVEAHILTVDEARAVLGYDPHPLSNQIVLNQVGNRG